jgi:2-haloacid dehalogenase
MTEPAIFVFDAYGTLFDVHSAVARHRQTIGPQADLISDLWRSKQLEYTWVRTLAGAYQDFEALTAQALDFAATRCGVGLSPALRASLLAAYETLDAFADARPALEGLKAAGARTAILSNGTPAMLASALASSGLADLIDVTISIHGLRRFKTVPEVYELVTRQFGLLPQAIAFQSSNRWDVAGAVKFGFSANWINRTGQPDEYADLPPQRVLKSLTELLG